MIVYKIEFDILLKQHGCDVHQIYVRAIMHRYANVACTLCILRRTGANLELCYALRAGRVISYKTLYIADIQPARKFC